MVKEASKIILVGYLVSSLLFFFFGSLIGEHKQKQIYAEILIESQEKYNLLERNYRKAIKDKEASLAQHKQKAMDDISDIVDKYDSLLQLAETKANYYEQLSTTGQDGCTELAGIATAYNRNLTRGTNVVGRLRAVTQSLNSSTSTLIETLDLSTELMDNSK